jgi:putative PIG3 family NAD(P)H quinone oxidoreductase
MKNSHLTANVIEISQPGAADVLRPATRNLAAPGPGEVLIKVMAAGVNRPDVFQRLGLYPPPPGASDIPGLEIAGAIMALGNDVSTYKIGARVMALVTGGGYADLCLAPIETLLPIPDGLNYIEAAAIPETFFTVWSNVFDRGGLKSGENFLVHGGSSGIGSVAIQLAKAFGARVFATAGSEEKCKFCRELGADVAINYKSQDFAEIIKGETAGEGVDVILDMVAGDYIPRNIASLKADGRLILIAFLGGSLAQVDFRDVMIKRLTISGSTLRARDNKFKSSIAAALRAKVWPLIEAGQVRPIIDSVYKLEDAPLAHARMETSAHMGKIMLENKT